MPSQRGTSGCDPKIHLQGQKYPWQPSCPSYSQCAAPLPLFHSHPRRHCRFVALTWPVLGYLLDPFSEAARCFRLSRPHYSGVWATSLYSPNVHWHWLHLRIITRPLESVVHCRINIFRFQYQGWDGAGWPMLERHNKIKRDVQYMKMIDWPHSGSWNQFIAMSCSCPIVGKNIKPKRS